MPRQLPFRYVLGSLIQRKGSALLTVGSFFLVTLIWVSLQAMISTIDETLLSSSMPDRGILLSKQASAENQSRLHSEWIHSFEGFAPLSKNADGDGKLIPTLAATTYAEHSDQRFQISVRGLDISNARNAFPKFSLIDGVVPQPYSNEALIGHNLAASLAIGTGDTLRAWRTSWTLSGVFRDQGTPFESELWVDLSSLYPILSRDEPGSAWFQISDPTLFTVLKEESERKLHGRVSVYTEAEFFSKKAFATEELRLLVAFVTIILSSGAILSSLNTLYASLSGREPELATFRALGFGKLAIVVSVLSEAVLIALTGGILAAFVAFLLNGITFRTLISGIGYLSFSLKIEASHLTSGLIFSFLMGLMGGFFPARQSIRKPIMDSLQRAVGLLFPVFTGLAGVFAVGTALILAPESSAHGQSVEIHFDLNDTAQDSLTIIPIQEAKNRAQSIHPTLDKMELLIEQKRYEEKIEKLNKWPSLQLFTQFYLLSSPNQYPRADAQGNLELISQGKPNDFILRIEARQALRGTLQSTHTLEILFAEKEKLSLEKELVWLEIETELEYLYQHWYFLNQEETLLNELLLLLRDQVQTRIQALEAGYESELDLLPAEFAFQDNLREYQRVQQEKNLLLYSLERFLQMAHVVPSELSNGLSTETADVVCEFLCEETIELWSSTEHPYLQWFDLSIGANKAERRRIQLQGFPQLDLAGRIDYSGPTGLFGADLPGLSPLQARAGFEVRFLFKESRAAQQKEQKLLLTLREIEQLREEWILQMDEDVRQAIHQIKIQCIKRQQVILAHEQAFEIYTLRKKEARQGLVSHDILLASHIEEVTTRQRRLQSDWTVMEQKFELAKLLARPPSLWSIDN